MSASPSSISSSTTTRRFLILRGSRWLPTGLLIPVLVLLLVERGFTLSQIGTAMAAQGVVVFLLELPTGGVADSIGRKPVLVLAAVIDVASLVLLLTADGVGVLVGVFALQGLYRALESGPLDAWYVDAVGPDADLERGLAHGGTVVGLAIATGALLSGAIVALDPVPDASALAVAVGAAIALRLVDLLAIATLLHEPRDHHRGTAPFMRGTPAVIASTMRAIRSSRALGALIAVELVWAFGMTAFETLAPVRLSEVTGQPSDAATLFGPAVAAAWLVSAAGAAALPSLSRRLGPAGAAMALHIVQGGAVAAMAISSGPVGVIAFYLLTLGVHGAVNPAYQTLLHRYADATNRTSVLSAASMAAHPGAALGGVALGFLAQHTSVTAAMLAGAFTIAAAAPLYRPARRDAQDRASTRPSLGLSP